MKKIRVELTIEQDGGRKITEVLAGEEARNGWAESTL